MKRKEAGAVLLVDDDSNVLESTSLILGEFGYRVLSSTNAEDAIKLIRKNDVDVVVTDIVMPEISGIELLRTIHDIHPSMPVILMTAYADMEKVIDALKIGAFDFIIKPYTAQLLMHSIEKAFNFSRMAKMESEYRHLLEEYNQEIEALVTERTMSLMALTIADRIRNPASVIGLICRRFLVRKDLDEELESRLWAILNEAEKLNSIVSEFNTLLNTRRSMFGYEDLNDVIRKIIMVTDSRLFRKEINIEYKPCKGMLKVNMQKNLFKIAISHLLRNAIEVSEVGSRITVRTSIEDEYAVIEVSDQGPGINPENRDRIFDPLFSTKKKRFGMGLPLVRRIVSEHMGTINLFTEPGKGTTFRIHLPLRWSGVNHCTGSFT